jgi:hypothetical protein
MKKYLLSITSLLFSALLIAQPSVTVLGEKVTITFPGSAHITSNEGGIKVFEYSKDSIILYAAMSMDMSLMGLQAETIKNMGDGIWNQMKSGMIQQMGSASVKKDEFIQFKGKKCLKLELDVSKTNSEELKGNNLYSINFFSGSNFYQISVLSRSNFSKLIEAEDFFNTLVIE